MCIPFRNTTCPLSGRSLPAIIFRRVVFPVPFLAMKAIFWSLLMPKEMFCRIMRSPKALDMFSTDSKFIINLIVSNLVQR